VLLCVGGGEDIAEAVGPDELPNISAMSSWLVAACPFGAGPAAGGTSSLNRSTYVKDNVISDDKPNRRKGHKRPGFLSIPQVCSR